MNEPLWKLVDKRGVPERPEYYIAGHAVRFEDIKEGFGKIYSVAILTRRQKVFSAPWTQSWVCFKLIAAKRPLMLLVNYVLASAQFYCPLSQPQLKQVERPLASCWNGLGARRLDSSPQTLTGYSETLYKSFPFSGPLFPHLNIKYQSTLVKGLKKHLETVIFSLPA